MMFVKKSKAFLIKYALGFGWIILNLVIFCKAFNAYHMEPEYYYLRQILGSGLCISRGTAPLINAAVTLTVLPVCRFFNQIVHRILQRISAILLFFYLEKVKVFHMTLTIGLFMISVIHSVAHIVNAFNFVGHFDRKHPDINWAFNSKDSVARLVFATPTGLTGVGMLFILMIIWLFSTRSTRDTDYNTFLSIHHLFLVFLGLMYIHPLSNIVKYQTNLDKHDPGCDFANRTAKLSMNCLERPIFSAGHKISWIWPTVALLIYIVDFIVRFTRRNCNEIRLSESRQLGNAGVFLKLKMLGTIFPIRPGQYCLLQCKEVSGIEWHPFTVTKCPTKDDDSFWLTIAIRGDWTRQLHEKIGDPFPNKDQLLISWPQQHRLNFIIDGPFPSPMELILKTKRVVCIAAGIGITPYIAMLNYLITNNVEKLERIHLMWIMRNPEQISWFDDTICTANDKFWVDNKPDKLDLKLFVTGSYDLKVLDNISPYLRQRIYRGRPHWNDLFVNLSTLYNKKSVTIFSCGPKTLTREVRHLCRKYNRQGFNYTFLHEGF